MPSGITATAATVVTHWPLSALDAASSGATQGESQASARLPKWTLAVSYARSFNMESELEATHRYLLQGQMELNAASARLENLETSPKAIDRQKQWKELRNANLAASAANALTALLPSAGDRYSFYVDPTAVTEHLARSVERVARRARDLGCEIPESALTASQLTNKVGEWMPLTAANVTQQATLIKLAVERKLRGV